MQRLFFFLMATTVFMPHESLAQYRLGGEYYQPYHNNWQQNQGAGDTVDYDGRVLTNNLTPNIDTCDWVRQVARLPCDYFGKEPNSSGYTTHFVGRPRPRWNNQNTHQWQNRRNWNHQLWNGGSECVYKDQKLFIRIPC